LGDYVSNSSKGSSCLMLRVEPLSNGRSKQSSTSNGKNNASLWWHSSSAQTGQDSSTRDTLVHFPESKGYRGIFTSNNCLCQVRHITPAAKRGSTSSSLPPSARPRRPAAMMTECDRTLAGNPTEHHRTVRFGWRGAQIGRRQGRAPSGVDGNGPKRFSVQRKMAIVARLLRGDPLELVARETNVSIARLSEWRERALAGAGRPAADYQGRPAKRPKI
jgi:hypothetical protein